MKKISFLLCLFLFFSAEIKAQYEYYDAIRLKPFAGKGYSDIEDDSTKEMAKLFYRAFSNSTDSLKIDSLILNRLGRNGNEFFKAVFGDSSAFMGGGNGNMGPNSFSPSVSGSISSLGGIDVTNIANGVAMLMIDRAKQELTITFFNRFQKYSKDHPEFQVLFPKTTDNLLHLLTYKYPEMLPALRISFFEDLDKLPIHLDDVLELPQYKDLLANFPEIRVAIRSVRLVQEIETGESNAAEILTQFASFKEWSQPNTSNAFFNFGNTVKLADIISQSLRYKNESQTADSKITINGDTTTTLFYKAISSVDKQKNKIDTVITFSKVQKKDAAGVNLTLSPMSSDTVTTFVKVNNIMKGGATVRDTALLVRSIRKKYSSGVITLDTFMTVSKSRDTDNEKRIWITPDQVKKLIEDDTLFRIYLGLILERVKSENIQWRTQTDTISFVDVMNENAEHIFMFQNKISEFMTLANAIDKVTDSLNVKLKTGKAFTEDDYYDYIDGSMNVIEYAFSFAALFDTSIKVAAYTSIARKANDLYRNIYKKEYTQAISNAISIIQGAAELIEKDQYAGLVQSVSGDDTTIRNVIKENKFTASQKRYLDSVYAVNPVKSAAVDKLYYVYNAQDKLEILVNILGKLNEYGLFMANMIDAKTPEEVQNVLDNVILPVGSSSIKKSACWNVAIQSYLGAYYRFAGKNHAIDNAWDDRFGVTAPIGLSISHGFNRGGSLSLFVSLFDIGAIVDYQLQKDTVITSATQVDTTIQKSYSIKLEQIISPGVYLVYGAPWNVPLAFGIGAQYGPGLGKIDLGSNNLLERNPSLRFNMFLGVDLPFFNLWNKTKGYKFNRKP